MWSNFHETWRVDEAWAWDESIRFWNGSGSIFQLFQHGEIGCFMHYIVLIQKIVDECS